MTPTTVQRVRPAERDWEVLGTHGLRRKVLGYDPTDQHVTSLVDIPVGWKGGGIAHFHHAFEEVFILSGAVTVGGTHYWHADDYFYRPALIVHGHDEKSPEGCLCLIRSDGPLELLLVHAPTEPEEYPLPGAHDPRGHILHLPTATVPWTTAPDLPQGWRVRPLSADAASGAQTRMVEVPAGWTASGDMTRTVAWEASVLKGAITGRTNTFETGDYSWGQPGSACFDATSSASGCTFLLWDFPRDREAFRCVQSA